MSDYETECDNCDGTGERDFLSGAKCIWCDGKGYLEYEDDEYLDAWSMNETDESRAENVRDQATEGNQDTEGETDQGSTG